MRERIRYDISLGRRNEHLVDVRLTIEDVEGEYVDLVMPAWIPGSYRIRDFARHVQDFSAPGLAWRKLSKETWRVETGGRSRVVIRYAVYAFEMTVRTSHVDADHAFLNGPSIFMCVDGRRGEPHAVKLPAGARVATGLGPRNGALWAAPGYDALIDCPIEIGGFERRGFTALGKPHEFVADGPGNYNLGRIVRDVAKIVTEAGRMFGGLPYERYAFVMHTASGTSGGGLEHSNSCALLVPPLDFAPLERYERFLNLAAHEFFHVWNVKRIIPARLQSFRAEAESYTELLWVVEGITSYYAPLILVRADLLGPKSYFKYLAKKIQAYHDKPGRRAQSLAEASFNAWIHLYQPSEQSINSQISYYEKGELVALLLDLEVRVQTNGRASLDDVMRKLYGEFAARGRGVGEGDVQRAVEAVAGSTFRSFFRDYVHGTRELPFKQVLRRSGLELARTPLKQDGSPDGWKAFLGVVSQKHTEKVVVSNVLSGSPAARAGVSAFDEIVALDGIKATPEAWERIMADKRPGHTLNLVLFRNGVLRTLDVRLGRLANVEYKLAPAAKIAPALKGRLVEWLRVPASRVFE